MSSNELNPDTWRRIAGVMEVALDLESQLRDVYLSSIGSNQPDIEEQVRDLFTFFGQEPGSSDPSLDSSGEPVLEGFIGPYKICSLLGQGGMGAVFLADHKEEGLERQVAVKVLHDRYGETVVRQRFLAERQILSSLRHPNIAQLHDAGTTADGRPYLVIEVVDGLPIDKYCDDNNLGLKQRLALFRKICQAVSYAHRNLVVHRDLKPSNILVTPEGEPKLLDFGIAKVLKPEAFDSIDQDLTRTSERPMTPSYASPEQIKGLPITTATDIFALGALLYKLLTGELPFRYGVQTPEIMQAVQEGGAQAPSAASTSTGHDEPEVALEWKQSLEGDLDNITMKALAGASEHGYDSVGDLDEDLRRFLAGEPVLATRGSFKYRLRKFIGRNRWPVALATLLSLSLAVGVSVAAWQANKIRLQRDQILDEKTKALFEKDRAEEVADFLTGLFVSVGPTPDVRRSATVQELIDEASGRIEEEDLGTAPATRAKLLDVLGNTYLTLGFQDRARELYDESLQVSRDNGLEIDLDFIQTQRSLANSLKYGGQEGRSRARELLKECYEWTVANGEVAETALVLMNQATLEGIAQNLEMSAAAYDEAIKLLEANPSISDDTRSSVFTSYGAHLLYQDKAETALPFLQQAIKLKTEKFGPDSPKLSNALNSLSGCFAQLGRFQDAVEPLERALEIDRDFYGGKSGLIGAYLVNSGLLYGRASGFDKAIPRLHEGLEVFQELRGPKSLDSAWALQSLGLVLLEKSEPTSALDSLHQSATVYEELYGPSAPPLRLVHTGIARALQLQGKFAQALEFADKSLAISAAAPKARSAGLRKADAHLAAALAVEALGRESEAQEHFQQAAETARGGVGSEGVQRQLRAIEAIALQLLGQQKQAGELIQGLGQLGYFDSRFHSLCGPSRPAEGCQQVQSFLPRID